MHFGRYLQFWSRRRGDALFVACDGERMSWAELDRASAALAAHLHAQGVRPGDRFGCLLGNSIPWCVAFAASIRLGAIFVPLNALFGRFELEQIAADAECAAVLSTPALVAKIGIGDAEAPPEDVRIYHRGGPVARYADVLAANTPFAHAPLADDDVLIIGYTSGTTGVPKGVMLTHRAVDTAIAGLALNFGLRGGAERLLILAPLAFTGGVISCLAVLLAVGGSAWLEKTVDPARAARLLRDERITCFGGVPALWERIARSPDFETTDFSHLKAAYTGGAPVPKPLLEAFRAKGVTIRQQYGFSEACGGVSSPDEAVAAANPESCGHALPGIELEVRDETGRRLGPGGVGEVHARGPQLMQGYWRKPEATAEAFDGEWYRTGDLARVDADGGLVIVDRKKNMLISGGVNIYPAEVERAIGTLPGVLEAVVLGVPSPEWGDEVAAIVHGPTLGDPPALLARLRELLGAVKAPKHLRISPAPLPKTASNKIARTGLRELFDQLPSS